MKKQTKPVPLFNPDRKQAMERLEYARKVGDTIGIMIAMAQLSQPNPSKENQNGQK